MSTPVDALQTELATAERELRAGYETLREMGETLASADIVAKLAQAHYVQGEYEEALHFSEVSEQAAGPEDLSPQVQWRAVRAKLLARRGEPELGVALAEEAVELAARTDFLVLHGDALLDLAETLRLAGELAAARPRAEEALALYERKGAAVPAARARALLSELS